MPTEEQAWDMGYAAAYMGEDPSFTGPWPQFHAYHDGYADGTITREQDEQDEG